MRQHGSGVLAVLSASTIACQSPQSRVATAFSISIFSRFIEARLALLVRTRSPCLEQSSPAHSNRQSAFLVKALLLPNASHAVGLAKAESRRLRCCELIKQRIGVGACIARAGFTAPGARSRQIVSLFSPDTIDLLNLPGRAATAGQPHQP